MLFACFRPYSSNFFWNGGERMSLDEINSYNEEDIKNKIIIPYLKNVLGLQENEIKYEDSFTLKAGRSLFQIKKDKSKKSTQSAVVYSDILISKNGRNLLIVEVKRGNKKIDSDDILQARSYAKLLDNIAPYCIITQVSQYNFIPNPLKLLGKLSKK